MNCHEAIDLMGDALEGAIRAGARGGFEEHLEECAACRNYLDQLRLTRGVLRRLPGESEPDTRRSDLIAKFRKELRRDS